MRRLPLPSTPPSHRSAIQLPDPPARPAGGESGLRWEDAPHRPGSPPTPVFDVFELHEARTLGIPLPRAGPVEWRPVARFSRDDEPEAVEVLLPDPPSPSPTGRARELPFAPWSSLAPLWVNQEVWDQEACRISGEALQNLEHPVALQIGQALHVMAYQDLKIWLRVAPANCNIGRRLFKNPNNNVWVALADLRRIVLNQKG